MIKPKQKRSSKVKLTKTLSLLGFLLLLSSLFTISQFVKKEKRIRTKASHSKEAVFSLVPASITVKPNETFPIQAKLNVCAGDEGCVSTTMVQLSLTFSSTYLQVDEDASGPVITIGDSFQNWFIQEKKVDYDAGSDIGTVNVLAFTFPSGSGSHPYTGNNDTFAAITFKAKSVSSQTNTKITFPFKEYDDTTDGNDVYHIETNPSSSIDFLSSVNNLTVTIQPEQVSKPTLSLVPRNSQVQKGDTFYVDLMIYTVGEKTVGADAVINYTKDIIKYISYQEGIYDSYEENPDSQDGDIDISGFTYTGKDPITNKTFITLEFKALEKGTASIDFVFDYPDIDKKDSNILKYNPDEPGREDAEDILAQVLDTFIKVEDSILPSPSPSFQPSPSPSPEASPSPSPSSQPSPSPSPEGGSPSPSPTDEPCNKKGNLTGGKCCIDGADVSIMFTNWGYNPANPDADIDKNNKVNVADLAVLLAYWDGDCN